MKLNTTTVAVIKKFPFCFRSTAAQRLCDHIVVGSNVGDVCEVKMGRSKYAGKIMAIGEYDCKSSAV